MNREKHFFNQLALKYYRYSRKLRRLEDAGKNLRRQLVIKKRLDRIIPTLEDLYVSIKQTATITAIAGASILCANQASAQLKTFEMTTTYNLQDIGRYSTPAVADLDNDGDLDIISGEFSGKFYYLENTGTASVTSFTTPVENAFGLQGIGSLSTPSLGDLDGDGDMDLISGSNDGDFYYFENIGTASAPQFATSVKNPFGLTANQDKRSSGTLVDLDNDGDLDYFTSDTEGHFYYFENTGTATVPQFAASVKNPFGSSKFGRSAKPTFADFDKDGDLDIIVGELRTNLNVYENTGTASAPQFSSAQLNILSFSSIGKGRAPVFIDLNNDGELDLLTGDESGAFFVNLFDKKSGNTFFYHPATLNAFGLTQDSRSSNVPVMADLDGDGDLDVLSLAFNHPNTSFSYFENTGTVSAPQFASAVVNPYSLGISIGDIAFFELVDLDGDGDLDLVGTGWNGDFIFRENTGTATAPSFGPLQKNPHGLTNLGYFGELAIADLDGDGDLDILTAEYYNKYKFYENTGTATAPQFAAATTNPYNLPNPNGRNGFMSSSLKDFDKDGDYDLLTLDGSGNFKYYENEGTKTTPNFVRDYSLLLRYLPLPNYNKFSFADLDNDGDFDMLQGATDILAYFENTSPFLQSTAPLGLSDLEETKNGIEVTVLQRGDVFNFETTVDHMAVVDVQGQVHFEAESVSSFSTGNLNTGIYLVIIGQETYRFMITD